MIKPDYDGGSIVNLMATIRQALGDESNLYKPLTGLGTDVLSDKQTILLFVIDGLGYEFLCEQGKDSFIYSQLHSRLTSVFPSTTASAITTFATGVAPAQHGVTGWFMLLEKLQEVFAVLPAVSRTNKDRHLDHEQLAHNLALPNVISQITQRDCFTLYPQSIVNSAYSLLINPLANRIGYTDLADFFEKTAQIVKSPKTNQYIYAYWSELDSLTHQWGTNNPDVIAHFHAIDAAFEKFVSKAKQENCRILLTADHGLIDSPAEKWIVLNDYPDILDCLRFPLCGEPRAAYCYLKPGHENKFLALINQYFSGQLQCIPSKQLIVQEYFGFSPWKAELPFNVGDYVLIPNDDNSIKDYLPIEKPFHMAGVHGGLSQKEMSVPLIIV